MHPVRAKTLLKNWLGGIRRETCLYPVMLLAWSIRGESFIKFSGEAWMDWKDALSVIGNDGDRIYVAYDNLPIKGYLYPLE